MRAVSERLVRLSEIRVGWAGRRDDWLAWQADLAGEPDLAAAYAGEIERALGRTTEVVGAVDRAIPGLVDLQGRLQDADAAARDLVAQGESLLGSWRAQLWRRGSPVLFSAAHRERLGGGVWAELRDGLRMFWQTPREPNPRTLWLLLLQGVVAVGAGWLAFRLRPKVPGDSRWVEVLRHPWAIGLLVGAAGLGFLHGALSPAARLPLVAAAALSASVVGTGMFRNPQKRLVVYLISGLYLTFAVLAALDPPPPLFRVGLAALALAGVPALLLLARVTTRRGWREQRGFLAALRLGAGALLAVLVAEVAGFHFLAQWLFEASVATAFVGFVITFLIRLARGALVLLFRAREGTRVRFLERVGEALTERLMLLAKLVLVGCGILYGLSIWDVAESPGAAWRAIVGAGVSIGEWRLTVGRVFLSVAAVYLAFLSSWVVRVLLDQSFFDRRPFERGVRDSISTLLHYSILVIGVLAALALFGLDLSSFAILAGALGVGIGFGLQNVVNNFVSGLVLLFERPLRVGDIAVVDGESGTIRKIGLRSTVLETFNGAELIIPNGDLIAEKVTNWTLSSPKARLVLPVSAAYGNDPERVLAILTEIGSAFPRALAEPAPAATFQGFGESSLDFDLRVWLAAFDEMLAARSELGAAVARRFAAEGIVIPFPQRTVHVERAADASGDLAEAGDPEPEPVG